MGVMRFLVPRRDLFAPDAVERAYMAGLDEIPWHARILWTAEGLSIDRAESDSGNFFFPCPLQGHGEVMLSTASLMERGEPYHLDVELARGTLNRLRNQMAAWESMGLSVPETVRTQLHESAQQFALAVTRQGDPPAAAERAMAASSTAIAAIERLAAAFAEQALAARHQQNGKINSLFGVNLGSTRPTPALGTALLSICNTAVVPLTWRDIEASEGKRDWSLCDAQIEWCRAAGLKICGGPLLQVDKWSLPDWMYLWGEEEADNFRNCVAEHLEAVVTRYRGKVQLWQCAARLNMHNDFHQDEGDRLRLAVLAIECIRKIDPRTPIVLSVDQPWGAFMGRGDYDLSPLHFADALVRAQLGLAGIGMEINFGYAPHGTEPRDVVEFARQVDRFSTMGLPILVSLTVPSGSDDALARMKDRVISYAADQAPSPATQRAWAERYLPVLLAKQPVQGIIWNQLLDSQPHPFANGGLFDAKDRPKPIVDGLASLRKEHLL
ncbi:MAG: endo-1,4-beta-xylanase [Pirellulales bacterium]